jgi:hypothetical protein
MGERDRNFEWLNARYLQIQRKYGGQYVAVVNQRIVASGKDAGSVLKKASRYSPQPHLAKIPREDVMVL